MLLADLYENGIVKYGKFKLKSGQESNYYVDIKSAISKPELFKKITKEFSCMIDDIKHHSNLCICGVPHGAVPFASALSYETGIPMIMLRKDVKTHGTRQQIEGECSKGTCVILIEDVTTTGTSLINAAQALKDNGLNVIKMLCIANRGNKQISFYDSHLESLINIPEQTSLDTCERYFKQKGRLCVAADVTTKLDLIKLIHNVGNHISVLKTHIDIISDFSLDFIMDLIRLKKKYNFLIWEDRKFADIGNVVSSQIHGGVYKISSWADLISMHVVSGPGILREAKNCGIIAIGSMSTRNTLADADYLSKTIDMISNENVVGVVTQYDCSFNGIKIVPGVNFVTNFDEKDQQYSSLSSKSWGNLFVVGRDIINSESPEARCLEYKKLIQSQY